MAEKIQSVEVSYFVHGTEDLERVSRTIADRLGLPNPPELESLEGHFGNRIVRVSHHLTGDEAMHAFRIIVSFIGKDGVKEMLAGLDLALDEHKALYIRLGKQELLREAAVFSSTDAVRSKIRPRGYMAKENANYFYSRLMEGSG